MSDISKSYRKIALENNVFEEGLKRVNFIFDEFENIVVGVSGGKDSTVVLELALRVAKERNRLPLKVMFLDQEAEWLAAIDMIKDIMSRPEVEPIWLQVPFKLFNATSFKEHWLQCWKPDDEENWIRPKEDISIKENDFGTERFGEMFPAVLKKLFPNQKACYLAGLRAEESPHRSRATTGKRTYKHITWGKVLDKSTEQYTFYPIYDWKYADIWKSIHENQWKYCKIYDLMYQYGVGLNDMRVSNLHHETAVHSLFILQELEPENYDKVISRLDGVDMAGKLQENFYCPKDLPTVFKSWREYRDYLLENLIEPDLQARFAKKFIHSEEIFYWCHGDKLFKRHIQSILTNDHEFVKLNNISVPRDKYDEHRRRIKDLRLRKKAEKEGEKNELSGSN